MQAVETPLCEETTCCIVGGGPAGAMLALLLVRKGVDVTLLEEHADFARDFRGDTVHPSTLEILEQLGLSERALQLKHTRQAVMTIETPRGVTGTIDLRQLPTRYPYIALIPQALFLDFLISEAARYPGFHLRMGARAEKLVEEDGYIHGVQYRAQDGWHELRALLTVGADGRFSRIRKLAGFKAVSSSQPVDVLWFRLPRLESEAESMGGRIQVGQNHLLVQLDRGEYWQLGYTFLKGSFQEVKAAGLACWRQEVAKIAPHFTERLQEITEWKQVSVLAVEASMVKRWYRPGLLVIGDAAHVMSPVAGVGINYAIQDAVATANLLTPALLVGKVPTSLLARVQRRRKLPTLLIQRVQRLLQRQIGVSSRTSADNPGLLAGLRFLLRLPPLRRIAARLLSMGPLQERVQHP